MNKVYGPLPEIPIVGTPLRTFMTNNVVSLTHKTRTHYVIDTKNKVNKE